METNERVSPLTGICYTALGAQLSFPGPGGLDRCRATQRAPARIAVQTAIELGAATQQNDGEMEKTLALAEYQVCR